MIFPRSRACAVVEQAVSDGSNGARDVGGFAHPLLREQTAGDLFFVGSRYLRDHIGADNSRLNLENRDAVRG
jgi:hypothetical protein